MCRMSVRPRLPVTAEGRLAAAILVSALAHTLLISAPAWRLPQDDEMRSVPIEARLLPPPKLAPEPAPAPRPATPAERSPAPKPRPAPAPPRAAMTDATQIPAAEASEPDAAVEPAPAVAMEAVPEVVETPPAAVPNPPAPLDENVFPRHGRVIYQAGYGAFRIQLGAAETVWQVQGDRYVFRLYVQPALGHTLMYQSEGRVSAAGFEPASFRVEQGGQFKEGAQFDRTNRRVVVASSRGHAESELAEASQDMLSAMFQVALFPPGEERTEIWVATGKRYSSRVLERVGEELLDTPLGPLRTVHVRIGREGDDQYDFWFGTDVNYLPVRVRLVFRGGTVLDFPAKEIQYERGGERVRLVPAERTADPRG
jgi:hypothetical protein